MKRTINLLMIILSIGTLMQFPADIYSPSIPSIANYFQAPMNIVQLSMAIYMFGVSSSLLIYGPLSEGYGRKKPLIAGLMIMLLGTTICYFSPSIYVLIFGRFLQGVGAGAGGCLWRAIFRDSFQGEELAKYSSYFTVGVTFILPAAPLLGGALQHYFDWPAIFIFLFVYNIATLLLVIFTFTESNQHHHVDRLKTNYIVSTFMRLLTNRTFMITCLCVFLTSGGFFSWFVIGPVLLIHRLGVTPLHFGWLCFIAGTIGFCLAGFLNAHYVEKFGLSIMLCFGWTICITAGILMLFLYLIFGLNLWAIYFPTILFYLGGVFIWPNAFSKAITPFGDIAGYAGTLYSFMKIGGAAVITAIVSHLPDHSQFPLACVYILCGVLPLLLYRIAFRGRGRP